jgi:hypothetical protein
MFLSWRYKAGGRKLALQYAHMNEMYMYRPITAHEKKMRKIMTEPRGYEYELIPLWQLEGRLQPDGKPEPKASKMAGIGLFLLAFLFSILDLPELPESGIEGKEEIETPQST